MSQIVLSPLDRIQARLVGPALGLPDRLQVAASGGTPLVIDGLTLEPELQLLFAMRKLLPKPRFCDLQPAESRLRIRADIALLTGLPLPLARVDDVSVAGADGALRARRYVPHGFQAPGPCLVYYHGGGWTIGDLETHDQTCRFLAARAGVTVISVDCRLAPEHPFPAPVDDSLAAFAHIHAHATDHGIDPDRIAVGGDSAGGQIGRAHV